MGNKYLSAEQQVEIETWLAEPMANTEWPTWVLTATIYGLWVTLIWLSPMLGMAISAVLLGVVSAWHMSLQHELIHGHPTRFAMVNQLLGAPPLSLWFPMGVYRSSHLQHHNDELLTLPGIDPETNYVSETSWARFGPCLRFLYVARKTALGRFTLGPSLAIARTWGAAVGQVLKGQGPALRDWLPHWFAVVVLLWFVDRVSVFSAWQYMLLVAYPALSLAMVRSHYEHRATLVTQHRIVINEAGAFFRILFLNNNYHLVHHDLPQLPWYLIPRVYRANRVAYLARCGGFHLHGYLSLQRRYAWTATDAAVHPNEAGLLARTGRKP
jgi:fatty acid desaturase